LASYKKEDFNKLSSTFEQKPDTWKINV